MANSQERGRIKWGWQEERINSRRNLGGGDQGARGGGGGERTPKANKKKGIWNRERENPRGKSQMG